MDYDLELEFQKLVAKLNTQFDADLDVQAILFLIGVQELGQGYDTFSKREKTELMHVAVCTVLEPYGHYKFIGKDAENWPHFEKVENLPHLEERQQQHLIKEAILDYFKAEKYEF